MNGLPPATIRVVHVVLLLYISSVNGRFGKLLCASNNFTKCYIL